MSESVRELVDGTLNSSETLHALTLTGSEDGVDYCLAVYESEHQGRPMIKERYVSIDRDEQDVNWLSNGINRRVNGDYVSFVRSIMRAYASMQQYAQTGEDRDEPLMIGAEGEDDAEMQSYFGDPIEQQNDQDQVSEWVDRRPLNEDPADGEVECLRCGAIIDQEDAIEFSSGPPLGEVWVCSGGCTDE